MAKKHNFVWLHNYFLVRSTKTKKIRINGGSALMRHLRKASPQHIGKKTWDYFRGQKKVVRKSFSHYAFRGQFTSTFFYHSRFSDCVFTDISGERYVFENCKFYNCTFENCHFEHHENQWEKLVFQRCRFKRFYIADGMQEELLFIQCRISEMTISDVNVVEKIRFKTCMIENSHFEYLLPSGKYIRPSLVFERSQVESTRFEDVDFKDSTFLDTGLFNTLFLDCKLYRKTFRLTRELNSSCQAMFDFETILKSNYISPTVLLTYFNITADYTSLKNTIINMTAEKDFFTVFISYSFKDSPFAIKLNRYLRNKGIHTFMWEKDAPGGQLLEDIMDANIGKHDKLLFIASQYSIKSRACQYELTTARKKQEKSWDAIFFPICIDDFLFKVKKNQVRPMDRVEEYWSNIEEIKRVNALDFTMFNGGKINRAAFEKAALKILDGLKKEIK